MREALALSVNVTAVAPTASTRTAANATSAAIAAVDSGPSSGHAAGPAWGANTFWHVMALKRALQ
jgi:hypothetical protein